MLRFVIEPASRDYYRQKGISFGFHQLLRVLDDPVSMIDPTGFLSERDTIVGHVMQVVHLNPVYDLQLIQMFPDGLEDFERQVQAMVDGTHPRARAPSARSSRTPTTTRACSTTCAASAPIRDTPPPVREEQTLRADPHFAAAERTFATLPGLHRLLPHAADRRARPCVRRLRTLERLPARARDRGRRGAIERLAPRSIQRVRERRSTGMNAQEARRGGGPGRKLRESLGEPSARHRVRRPPGRSPRVLRPGRATMTSIRRL